MRTKIWKGATSIFPQIENEDREMETYFEKDPVLGPFAIMHYGTGENVRRFVASQIDTMLEKVQQGVSPLEAADKSLHTLRLEFGLEVENLRDSRGFEPKSAREERRTKTHSDYRSSFVPAGPAPFAASSSARHPSPFSSSTALSADMLRETLSKPRQSARGHRGDELDGLTAHEVDRLNQYILSRFQRLGWAPVSPDTISPSPLDTLQRLLAQTFDAVELLQVQQGAMASATHVHEGPHGGGRTPPVPSPAPFGSSSSSPPQRHTGQQGGPPPSPQVQLPTPSVTVPNLSSSLRSVQPSGASHARAHAPEPHSLCRLPPNCQPPDAPPTQPPAAAAAPPSQRQADRLLHSEASTDSINSEDSIDPGGGGAGSRRRAAGLSPPTRAPAPRHGHGSRVLQGSAQACIDARRHGGDGGGGEYNGVEDGGAAELDMLRLRMSRSLEDLRTAVAQARAWCVCACTPASACLRVRARVRPF